MSPARARRIAAGLAVASVTASATGPQAPAAPRVRGPAPITGPTLRASWAARIVLPTAVRAAPRVAARRVGTLATRAAGTGGQVRLLVLGTRRDAAGRRWLRVALPQRPNGRSGWIDANLAQVTRVRWQVEIAVRARRLTVFHDGRRVRSWRVVVGAPRTPTPRGLFAVYARVRQPPGSELGPWALHLTAHSNVLFDYGGGPGRVAMHGRSGPLLADPLGTAASHGCIRMRNANVRWLAARAAPGTPVRIR